MKIRNTLNFVMVAMALVITACGSNNNNSGGGGIVAAVPTYGYVSGTCMNITSNIAVAPSYCTTTTPYSWSGQTCVQQSTGQAVNTSYCQGITNPYGYPTAQLQPTQTPGLGGAVCVGYFYYANPSYSRLVSCNGTNCRGYIMYTQAGQPIYCQ